MTTMLAILSAGLVKFRRVQVEASGGVASLERDGGKRARWCSVFASGRIRASNRENELSSSMELWPGVSSSPEFEFGCQEPHDEFPELDEIDRNLAFSELKDALVQPYMGDVDMLEGEEPPAKYVPPPPVPLEDMEMRNKGEEVMYTLLKCLPGPMRTLLHDQEKWHTLVQLFSETVEFQDPLICLKGIHSLKRLLKVLCHADIVVNLHEVYYENIALDRFKRCVYAVWTATFTNNLEESLEKSKLTEWWETAHGSLVDHLGERQDGLRSTHGACGPPGKTVDVDREKHSVKSARHRVLELSGESKFEVNKEGKVKSISSRWFNLAKNNDKELVTPKVWLAGLYSRNGV